MEYLRACGLQVFLTTTDQEVVADAAGADAAVFTVARGGVQPEG
jgi:recombinational DNA repair ATPase RecF